MIKLNFGCGENRLEGWKNHDKDVDISKTLPYPDNYADFIFCEHCVEHIDYYSAIKFFKECHRVLKPNGVARITVPSLSSIMNRADDDYCKFTTKWQKLGSNRRGAMHAILYAHGHKTAWTADLLLSTLYYCGFDRMMLEVPGRSDHPELQNVEGHHKIIGDHFNNIESCVCEGIKF